MAYRDATVLVTPREVPRVVADDVDDDHVIAAAVAARVQYIVTGDRTHLLPIGTYGDIAIISPRQCLDLWGPEASYHAPRKASTAGCYVPPDCRSYVTPLIGHVCMPTLDRASRGDIP